MSPYASEKSAPSTCSLSASAVYGGCPAAGSCVVQGVNVSGYGTAAAAVEGKCGRWTNYTVLVAGGAIGSCPYTAAKAGGGRVLGIFYILRHSSHTMVSKSRHSFDPARSSCSFIVSFSAVQYCLLRLLDKRDANESDERWKIPMLKT